MYALIKPFLTASVYYNYLVLGWMLLALFAFILLLYVTAPYGRHTSSNWGGMLDHKIGWILMEFPAVVVCPIVFYMGDVPKSAISYLFIFLWVAHYINRTFIFPLRTKTTGKKIPLVIVFSAIFFNVVNGFICGYYLGFIQPYALDWMYSWQFILGLLVFLTGMAINMSSDTILINLRSGTDRGYKIPKGGLFRYISCPNLFGEIVEWAGFAIMTWSVPILSFWIWTFANLSPRAIAHHQWYHQHFDNYPKKRKAVIPFLW